MDPLEEVRHDLFARTIMTEASLTSSSCHSSTRAPDVSLSSTPFVAIVRDFGEAESAHLLPYPRRTSATKSLVLRPFRPSTSSTAFCLPVAGMAASDQLSCCGCRQLILLLVFIPFFFIMFFFSFSIRLSF